MNRRTGIVLGVVVAVAAVGVVVYAVLGPSVGPLPMPVGSAPSEAPSWDRVDGLVQQIVVYHQNCTPPGTMAKQECESAKADLIAQQKKLEVADATINERLAAEHAGDWRWP